MTYIKRVVVCVGLLASLGGCAAPLQEAAYRGDTKTVLALLEQGGNPDNFELGDMLCGAAAGGHNDVIQLLLERGVNVNQGDSRAGRFTALHCAAERGQDQTVRFLIERGADLNVNGFFGITPLHEAVRRGHSKVVQLLLSRGANAGIADYQGMTPLKIAEQKGHTAIVQLLRQAEAKEMGLAPAPSASPQVAAVPPVSAPVPVTPAITSDVDRVPTLRTATKKHAYAVVIGIEQYREKLPKADFADRDAKLVGEYLTKVLGYPEENVIVRTNERATRTDLVKYFEEWLRNNVEKDSSVFIYYSGHGAPNTKTGEAYFVPYDGDPSFVDSTAYPVKQLYAALDKLPAKDIMVVLDSCFSGAGGRSVLAKGARPMGLSIENATLASGKTVVLAASGGDQISNSFEEKGHGLLTYYFLKGLQGEGDANKDGAIEMAELYDYVKPNVQRIARKQYNNEQTPQLLASPDVLKRGGGRLVERVQP